MNLLDRAIAIVSPGSALKRIRARTALQIIDGAAYTGASRTRRSLRGYSASVADDPDDDILPELEVLRQRSRDLVRNNPVGGGAVKNVATNVVGSGLHMQSRIDREYLAEVIGLSDEEADRFQDRVNRLFRMWAGYPDADAGRGATFYELQNLALLTQLQDGECFTLLPLIQRKGTVSQLRVKVLSGSRVSTPYGVREENGLAYGIELGRHGDPVAYYIETTPKGELRRTWTRVMAFGSQSGRVNVIHLFRREYPEQRRGIPYLSPVIEPLKQIARYTESELMAAVVSSMFTVFIKSPTASPDILDAAIPSSESIETDPQHYELGSGAIVGLGEGEEPVFANPGRPNSEFDPFVTALLRQIGMALEIPYEVLVRHFQSSYSAARGALMEAWKFFKARRQWLAEKWCQPIYEEWLTDMIISGHLDAPGYFDSVLIQRAYSGADWIGPAPIQLDPTKEVTASKERVAIGFSSKSEETMALTGRDWFDVIRQRAKEEAEEKRLGLSITEVTYSSATVVETNPEAEGDTQ